MDAKRFGFNETMVDKRARLLERGVDPYPYRYERPDRVADVLEQAAAREQAGQELGFAARTAGRLWSRREMGKSVFCDLRDGGAKIQLYFRRDRVGEEAWAQLGLLDLGDLVGVAGQVFRTRTGELSVMVEELTILAKITVPIPMGKETEDRTYFRVSDPESRYRERYLHWLVDDTDRERILTRSRVVTAIRRRMEADGFLEVTTPTIEFVYGGAEARPFRTSIWALGNREAFLRISPELYLKRYLVAGFERVFTICQNFRNEGIDHSHNPEFTMMEWYEAFSDYHDQMVRLENLVADVCREIRGTTRIVYQGREIDLAPPWRRLSVLDALREYAGVDAGAMDAAELGRELAARGLEPKGEGSWGSAVARLFEATCEEHLIQPTFVIDHPVEISPLTKIKRGDNRLVERFEPFICGMEIANAYSELNDPVDQLQRLTRQRSRVERDQDQDWEDHPIDADFVKAIGCGMPPTGGLGLGIDRLVMLLTDAASIRDIIPFPMIRPKA